MIIVNVVVNRTQNGTNLFDGINSLVIELSKEFEIFQLQVKQNLNIVADHHAKEGTRLRKGNIWINGVGGSKGLT
jgi:hypothetical protein